MTFFPATSMKSMPNLSTNSRKPLAHTLLEAICERTSWPTYSGSRHCWVRHRKTSSRNSPFSTTLAPWMRMPSW